jgi:hypothetical protein
MVRVSAAMFVTVRHYKVSGCPDSTSFWGALVKSVPDQTLTRGACLSCRHCGKTRIAEGKVEIVCELSESLSNHARVCDDVNIVITITWMLFVAAYGRVSPRRPASLTCLGSNRKTVPKS